MNKLEKLRSFNLMHKRSTQRLACRACESEGLSGDGFLISPDFKVICECCEQPIGYMVKLTDMNKALIDIDIDATNKMIDLREAYMRNSIPCVKCQTVQVQMISYNKECSHWRCRRCLHKWLIRP